MEVHGVGIFEGCVVAVRPAKRRFAPCMRRFAAARGASGGNAPGIPTRDARRWGKRPAPRDRRRRLPDAPIGLCSGERHRVSRWEFGSAEWRAAEGTPPMRIWTLHPKYLDAKGLV